MDEPHCLIIALVDQEVLGFLADCNVHALLSQGLVDVFKHQVNDLLKIFFSQMVEFDNSVEPVEKFRTEVWLQPLGQAFFLIVGCLDHSIAGVAGIGGGNNDRVLKVDRIALSIRQPTIIQHLQKQRNDLWISLFNFVKQHD